MNSPLPDDWTIPATQPSAVAPPVAPSATVTAPVPSPAAVTAANAVGGGAGASAPQSLAAFLQRQRAPQGNARFSWNWAGKLTSSERLRRPQLDGYSWSISQSDWDRLSSGQQTALSHAGRMLETELGEELLGEARCTACRVHGRECWVYTKDAHAYGLGKAGRSCAHCRLNPSKDGCSLSGRKKSGKDSRRDQSPSPPTRPRYILPKGGQGPPPGGAAGAVAA